MTAPTIQPVGTALPRVFDGDLVQAESGVWLVLGDTPGSQSRKLVTVPPGWAEQIFNVEEKDLAPLVISSDATRQPEALTAAKAFAQVRALTGQPFPPAAPDCSTLAGHDDDVIRLRDGLASQYKRMLSELSKARDPKEEAALMLEWKKKKAEDDKTVNDALSAAQTVAAAIPYIGAVISALIMIARAFGGGAAQGPEPQYWPVRDRWAVRSYRLFTLGPWDEERPIGELPDWGAVETALAARTVGFIDKVESSFAVLSKVFRLDFRCVFPGWWDRPEAQTATKLRELRFLAARWATDPVMFRSKALLDTERPRYSFETLPDADSEAIQKMAKQASAPSTPPTQQPPAQPAAKAEPNSEDAGAYLKSLGVTAK